MLVDAGILKVFKNFFFKLIQISKIIDTLLKGNIKDKDVTDDLEYVGGILEKNLKILSSFEKYVKELNTQILEWNPVHTEKFWKENVKKFEDQDFLLIRSFFRKKKFFFRFFFFFFLKIWIFKFYPKFLIFQKK